MKRVIVLLGLLVAGGLVAILAFMLVNDAQVAHEALKTRDKTEATAATRIDALIVQINTLQSQVTADGGVIGELVAQIQVLEEQVKELGGRPIIVDTTTAPTQGQGQSPSPTPVTTPPPSAPPTTTTTTPAHGPPTTTPGQKCIVIVCVP